MAQTISEQKYEFRHHLPIQMRFGDIDVFGHVNNTVYLQYADLAKLTYIHDVLGTLFDPRQNALVIASINCDYHSPTFYGEPIEVLTACEAIGTHSITFEQRIINVAKQQVKCIVRTVMVGFDVPAAQSMEIPSRWRSMISEYEQRTF